MPEMQPGQVTMGDLYHELVGVRADVSKALVNLEIINTVNTASDALHKDHETRIRALEQFHWKLAGIVLFLGILSAVASAVAATFMHR